MIDHDSWFKTLFTTFFIELLDLFLPNIAARLDPASLQFLDKEIFTDIASGERHEVDILVKVRWKETLPDQPSEAFFLVHIENQAAAQSDFNRRMFQYFARLHEKHGLPIYPVAVFSFDKPKRAEPEHYRVDFPGRRVLDFHYHVIQLNRLSWRDYVNRKNPVASALMSKMQIEPKDRPRVKLECLRLLATLQLDPAKMQLISGFVDTYLPLDAEEKREFEDELERETPQQKEEVMQIVTSWMREGLEQGLERGLEQGRRQEALDVALDLLNHRLGSLPVESARRIRKLELDELHELRKAQWNFESASDLEEWLQSNVQKTRAARK